MRCKSIAVVLGVLLPASFALPMLYADDQSNEVVDRSTDVIHAFPDLSGYGKQVLCGLVKDEVTAAAPLGADKASVFADDLMAVMPDLLGVRPAQLLTAAEVDKLAPIWRLRLHNALAMPSLEQTSRVRIDKDVMPILDHAVARFIETSYKDTPLEVRQDLTGSVTGKLRADASLMGNYFNPGVLYVKHSTPDVGSIVKALKADFQLQDRDVAYAPFAQAEEQATLPATHQSIRQSFVDAESSELISVIESDVLPTMFDPPPTTARPLLDLTPEMRHTLRDIQKSVGDRYRARQEVPHDARLKGMVGEMGGTVNDGLATLHGPTTTTTNGGVDVPK